MKSQLQMRPQPWQLAVDAVPKLKGTLVAASALLIWLGFLVWLAPAYVVPRGDDFGYIESVVDTVRAHRWVSSDWLEPLNLPLAVGGALCYAITGNFYASTFGLNLTIAWVNIVLLGRYLCVAIGPGVVRWPIALGLCLLLPWLNKAIEYTGVSFGIMCTLGAWLSWRRGWRFCFFACVLIGFLNRQIALCLLAWPLLTLVQEWRVNRRIDVKNGLGIFLTLALSLAILFTARPTFARAISDPFSKFSPTTFAANVALAFVVLSACHAAWGIICGAAPVQIFRNNVRRPFWPICCMALSAAIVFSNWHGLRWETPGMETFGLLVFVVGTTGGAWLNRWDTRFPPEVGLFVAGCITLISVRGTWWDYYFFEPALALLCVPQETPKVRTSNFIQVGGLLAGGIIGALLLKSHLTGIELKTVTYERALRAGDLSVVELSDAVFGYLGWKLFSFARERPDSTALSDFLKFVEGSRARFTNAGITVRRDGERRSIHPTMTRWQLPSNYIDRPLPLSNDEWRAYINAP